MNLPDAPIANEGFFATHFFTVSDQDKSKDFYVRILGGKVINPCCIKLANTWIILNSGGGPTPDTAVSSAFEACVSRLCVHALDPLRSPCGSHEWIRKVLRLPRNLVVFELHDAHGVGRLAVICQDEFGDPKIAAANDSPDGKPLVARLTGALALYVTSTAGSLA